MTARILALFIGVFTLANLLGGQFWPGFDANIWWIQFGHILPAWLVKNVLAISAMTLVAYAARNRPRGQRAIFTAVVASTLAVVALLNTISFYRVAVTGQIDARFPVPLSLVICASLLWIAWSAWRKLQTEERRRGWVIAAGGMSLFALFPLGLMIFFGNTDYRRPADAAIVFGAKAQADGRPTNALADRIRTACSLYRAGLVKRLVMSGGRGEGSATEADVMRQFALTNGVAASDIFIDNQGVDTEATVRNTSPLLQQWHARRVLVVSHFYHLPRIKLAYQRAGFEVYTVPAPQGHLLGKMPYYMAREVAAFWSYYFKEKPVTPAVAV